MKKKTLQVITLGCSKNTVDTEHLLAAVADFYEIVPEGEEKPVDVLLVNTCGFIGDAKQQSIDTVLACAERKKAGLVGSLLVMGCLSQRYLGTLPDLIPEVDGWFGARDLAPVVKALGGKAPARWTARRSASNANNRLPYAFLKISERTRPHRPGYHVLRAGPVSPAGAGRIAGPLVGGGRH